MQALYRTNDFPDLGKSLAGRRLGQVEAPLSLVARGGGRDSPAVGGEEILAEIQGQRLGLVGAPDSDRS